MERRLDAADRPIVGKGELTSDGSGSTELGLVDKPRYSREEARCGVERERIRRPRRIRVRDDVHSSPVDRRRSQIAEAWGPAEDERQHHCRIAIWQWYVPTKCDQ